MSHAKDEPPISAETLAGLSSEAQEVVRAIVDYYEKRIDDYERRIQELETRLNKTPQNSSKPPSSQHPHARPKPKPKRKRSGRKRGGQHGHQKYERPLIPTDQCTEVFVLKPSECRRCGKHLCGEDADPLRHQVWELPEIQPLVSEYQLHRLGCACGTTTAAPLPAGVPVGQSGPRLVAFVTLMMAFFRHSKRRTALFVESVFNIPCSSGLTVKHQKIATQALSGCYQEMVEALPHVETMNMDETSTKQSGRKAWLWVAATTCFTVFAVRMTRAAKVVKDLLGQDYKGVITCDRMASYNTFQRQFCWAHLKRDFQAMIDAGGKSKRVGKRLMDVTNQLFKHWHRYRGGTIKRETMKRNIHSMKYSVWDALEEGMRCGHSSTAGTCCHLFGHFDYLWTFLDQADIEPTNNTAERALRHAVIWRKTSFGTQSESGSRFVETLLSVIETCRQQDRDVLSFVTHAIEEHFADQAVPSLIVGL